MRKFLNKLLSPLGYQIQRLDRFQHEFGRLIKSVGEIRFVQIGAHDGVRFDGLYSLVTAHRCAGLVVEPLPDVFARLVENYSRHPAITPINKAVHATAQSLPLYRVAPSARVALPPWTDGIASFEKSHLLKYEVPDHCIETQQVQCVDLMSLLTAENFLDAHVLQVDVEGYDAEVIRMIDFARFQPFLIKYEHRNLSSDDAEFIEALLRRQGYHTTRDAEDVVAWRQ